MSGFRDSLFYLDGTHQPPSAFPFLRRLNLWLNDFAPVGPSIRNYCWLDVMGPVVDRLGCWKHGHEPIIDGNGPPPVCRWCHATQDSHR